MRGKQALSEVLLEEHQSNLNLLDQFSILCSARAELNVLGDPSKNNPKRCGKRPSSTNGAFRKRKESHFASHGGTIITEHTMKHKNGVHTLPEIMEKPRDHFLCSVPFCDLNGLSCGTQEQEVPKKETIFRRHRPWLQQIPIAIFRKTAWHMMIRLKSRRCSDSLSSRVYWLGPNEFVCRWRLIPPSFPVNPRLVDGDPKYHANLTSGGCAYICTQKLKGEGYGFHLGEHFRIRNVGGTNWISFPDLPAPAKIRHLWVVEYNPRPFVPMCCLHLDLASPHVPYVDALTDPKYAFHSSWKA